MVFRREGHGRQRETLRVCRGPSAPGVPLVVSEIPSWAFLVYVFLGGWVPPVGFGRLGALSLYPDRDTPDTPLHGDLDRA